MGQCGSRRVIFGTPNFKVTGSQLKVTAVQVHVYKMVNITIQPSDPCSQSNSTNSNGGQNTSNGDFAVGVIVAILGSTGEQLGLTLWKLAENRSQDRAKNSVSAEPIHAEHRSLRRIRESIMGGSIDLSNKPKEWKSASSGQNTKFQKSQNGFSDSNLSTLEATKTTPKMEAVSSPHSLARQNSLAESVSSIFAQKDCGRTSGAQADFGSDHENEADSNAIADMNSLNTEISSQPTYRRVHIQTPPNSANLCRTESSSRPRLDLLNDGKEKAQDLSRDTAVLGSKLSEEQQQNIANPEPGLSSRSLGPVSRAEPSAGRDGSQPSCAMRRVTIRVADADQGPRLSRPRRRGCLDREGLLGLIAFCVFVMGNGLNFVALGLIQVSRPYGTITLSGH